MRQRMRLVLSGGGTGGHIVPNIALIQELRERYGKGSHKQDHAHEPFELLYIGSRNGMEKKMVSSIGVPYRGIFCGKIRRYFSWKNFLDALLVPVGILQSFFIVLFFRPRAVFCKGGFVSFPVAVGAWLAGARVILHESDVVPGLSNRLAGRFASVICVSFEETKKYFHHKKNVVVTGNPVRRELLDGDGDHAIKMTGFDPRHRVLLFMGGSQGAGFINELVWDNLEKLTEHFNVIHICGKGKRRDIELQDPKRYRCYEYVGDDLKHFYDLAEVIVSRAGANTLSEIALLGTPAILVPLSRKVSRGDQFDNAEAYAKKHPAFIMDEDEYDREIFLKKVEEFSQVKRKPPVSRFEAAELIISLMEKK